MNDSCFNSTNSLLTTELAALNPTVLSQSNSLQVPLSQEFHSASSSTMLLQPVAAPLDPFIVTSTADTIDTNDGVITLREAINAANTKAGADTLSFNLGTGSQTITLTNGQLHILDDLTIKGLGADNLTISGGSVSRVFQVGSDPIMDPQTGLRVVSQAPTVVLDGLRIADGRATGYSGDSFGGGIFNTSNLTVSNSVLQLNISAKGGGIFNWGTMRVINTTLQNNLADSGGAINNVGVMEVISSTIKSNTVYGGQGGGIRDAGQLTIIGSAIFGNRAADGGGIYSAPSVNSAVRPVLAPIIKNSTVAGNQAPWEDAPQPDIVGGVNSRGGNLLGFVDGRVHHTGGSSDRVGTASNPLQPMFDLTVDTLVDEMDNNFNAGDLSLREALSLISPGGIINFAGNLSGIINLNLGELLLEKNVTIDGPGANRLTIDGNWRSRVMNVASYVSADLEGLTITGGFSENNGGGIWMNRGSEVTLTNVMVSNNIVGNSTGGGGIWNDRGTLNAINSTFSGNSAGFGGAILNGNSAFSNDHSSTVNLTNSTIAENQASFIAGGIYNQIGSLTLTSSTVSANQGIGVFNTDTATVHNTILAGNTAVPGGTSPDVNGTFISKGYNLIGNSTGSTGFGRVGDQVGTSQQPIDPKLGPLEDYNSSVYSMIPQWGSRAINSGNPTLSMERDQNGVLRSQGSRPDIGAVEWVNLAPSARNDSFQLQGRSVTFNVLTNDSSSDGDRFQITSYTQPRNGSLTRNADGSFTYQSQNGISIDFFSYTITDENGASSTATVSLRGSRF